MRRSPVCRACNGNGQFATRDMIIGDGGPDTDRPYYETCEECGGSGAEPEALSASEVADLIIGAETLAKDRALLAEREVIAQKARAWAEHYPQSSDGRNTFVLFAEWVEARSSHHNARLVIEAAIAAENAHPSPDLASKDQRIQELEEALEPFARVADSYKMGRLARDLGYVTFINAKGQRIQLSPIYFKEARALLQPETETGS